jgi:hypothetical protein
MEDAMETGLVEVHVAVPMGMEGAVEGFARRLCEDFPHGIRARIPHYGTEQEEMVALVRGIVRRYKPLVDGPRQMARDANSRPRDWYVEVDGVGWPLKALYWHLAQEAESLESVSEPRRFHTTQADEYLKGLGFRTYRVPNRS